jgi:hypothetical protein
MGSQLDRLIEAAGLPGIVVQVLPFRARDNAGADGAIAIYEFADAPAVCYTECYSGGRIVEGRDEVAALTTVMSLIRASALPPHESLGLMRQIRSEFDEQQ